MFPLSGRPINPISLQRCVETAPQFLPMLKKTNSNGHPRRLKVK
jgi:hypothetical protein